MFLCLISTFNIPLSFGGSLQRNLVSFGIPRYDTLSGKILLMSKYIEYGEPFKPGGSPSNVMCHIVLCSISFEACFYKSLLFCNPTPGYKAISTQALHSDDIYLKKLGGSV